MHVQHRCGSLSITTKVLFLANGFDVPSVMHGQVSVAAVSQKIRVIHEAMNGCKKSKDSIKDCFKNVYIITYLAMH